MKEKTEIFCEKAEGGTCRPFIRELSKANIMMRIDRGEKGGKGEV